MKYLRLYLYLIIIIYSSEVFTQSQPEFKISYEGFQIQSQKSFQFYDRREYRNQFSFGPGVLFLKEYRKQFGMFTLDAGFRSPQDFILFTGADFIMEFEHDENKYYSAFSANIFCAPAIMLETGLFKFYLGGGAALNIPNIIYMSSVFGLARIGIKPDNYSSVDIQTKVPLYLYSNSAFNPLFNLCYTIQF